MMGLVRDTSRGLLLTPLGMQAASYAPTIRQESFDTPARLAGSQRRRPGDWWA